MQPAAQRGMPLTGTPGLDIFAISGASISGWLPSEKTGVTGITSHPWTTQREYLLALYLEYHPWVVSYQRGDVSKPCAQAHRIAVPLGTPYAIPYVYDGTPHDYLPDYVGTLRNGGLLVAEAGLTDQKARGQALAKADAGRRLSHIKGGVYWLGTEDTLENQHLSNLAYLHARRDPFPGYEEIERAILPFWRPGQRVSVRTIMQALRGDSPVDHVEASAWKVVGDAAARGHLVVDLCRVQLDRDTEIVLLAPEAEPILPPPLPESLVDDEGMSLFGGTDPAPAADDQPLGALTPRLPGPTLDPSDIKPDKKREAFERNFAAVTEVLAGDGVCAVAQKYGMHQPRLTILVDRALEHGQKALVPHGSYRRESDLRPEFKDLIKKLYTAKNRPTIMATVEHHEMKKLAVRLTKQEGRLILLPAYDQVYRYVQTLRLEPEVDDARSDDRHPRRPRMSPWSFVLSIPTPAMLCQIDEHHHDVTVVDADGHVICHKVHGAAMICVKTSAILSAILSLDPLKEEDYMRLVKMAVEPKDHITRLYECKHEWSVCGKPTKIFHDRGVIFVSKRAKDVVVDRLKITSQKAPPYCPSAKGTVEALFTWITNKFTHRLPGTTKSNPTHRGRYDTAAAAEAAGITLDVLEKYFYQAIVDGYMREWDDLRRQQRNLLWESDVERFGVPHYLGSKNDLLLLLMKAQNRKNPATGQYAIHNNSISFKRRWYTSPTGVLNRLRGQEVSMYYDRRDISVVYIFHQGRFVGEVYCVEFKGRRVSEWEADAQRKADRAAATMANAESRDNRTDIMERAHAGKRAQRKESLKIESARQLDIQRPAIHPPAVLAMLNALEESERDRAQERGTRQEPAQQATLLAPAVPDDTVVPFRTPKIRRSIPTEEV